MPKRIAAAAITAVADSGADGDGALGVLESAGAKATLISMDPGAVGCGFEPGRMATGLFAAPGAAGDQRTVSGLGNVRAPLPPGRASNTELDGTTNVVSARLYDWRLSTAKIISYRVR